MIEVKLASAMNYLLNGAYTLLVYLMTHGTLDKLADSLGVVVLLICYGSNFALTFR